MIQNCNRHKSALFRNLLCIIIFIFFIFSIRRCTKQNSTSCDISESAKKFINFKEQPYQDLNKSEIIRLMNEYNKEEKILNLDVFGPLTNDTIVVVILVHKFNNLKYFIASLCDVRGIQDALIIFSHSYLDVNVNALIASIDFCRVSQIFYTYSLQVFTHAFPGYSKNDCPHDANIARAEFFNCIGASTPDIHGKYRQPNKAEKKHFWWWTACVLFENLKITRAFNGTVVFLEKDFYLIEDFIYMIVFMRKISNLLPQSEFLSLESSIPSRNLYSVDSTSWDPKLHSGVLAFDVSVWNIIVENYNLFCDVDDSSWSRSMLYLSLNKKNGKRFKVLHSGFSRAATTSRHRLSVEDSVMDILSSQKTLKTYLFPPYLEVYTNIELEDDSYVIFDLVEGEGGWSDPRDILLCKNMIRDKTNILKINN